MRNRELQKDGLTLDQLEWDPGQRKWKQKDGDGTTAGEAQDAQMQTELLGNCWLLKRSRF